MKALENFASLSETQTIYSLILDHVVLIYFGATRD